jgi:DNA (cytosine-5)-methyltransferase 1
MELIKRGHIADGYVDTRSIAEVQPDDITEFTQCHFFAGIGGWSYALRLAGWPDDRSVWTGSCPCQPFSSAGKGKGAKDNRHLWPYWNVLIAECRPPVVFGEQVEAAIRHGWLDTVFGDLEVQGYACGAVVLGAHSVGAPHIRQRVWFVAESQQWAAERYRQHMGATTGTAASPAQEWQRVRDDAGNGEHASELAESDGGQPRDQRLQRSGRYLQRAEDTDAGWVANRQGPEHLQDGTVASGPQGGSTDRGWIYCRDGKWRPVEPGTFPLAHGVPARVGRLRGYGNAIVPQVAQAFIEAYLNGT